MPSLGIDVGGANLKVANSDGDFRIIHLPIWKRLGELEDTLRRIEEEFNPDIVGVVMTAELSDIFESKRKGVLEVAGIVRRVFDPVFFDLNGNFRSYEEVEKNPEMFMASNWVASCEFLLKEGWRKFLFADMGSTTTDLIPVTDGIEAGKTDYERLKRGELLYFGVLRTPVFYILPEFDAPLSSEFFAISGDVFVVTGDIRPEDYICETPDGRGRDLESCMRRLARCVCADLEEVGREYVSEMARAFKEEMLKRLEMGIRRLADRYDLKIVLGCGIGEFLLKVAAEMAGLEYISLSEIYGEVANVFPAYAIARLLHNRYILSTKPIFDDR